MSEDKIQTAYNKMKHQPLDVRISYIDQSLKMIVVEEKNFKDIDFWLDVRLLAMQDIRELN